MRGRGQRAVSSPMVRVTATETDTRRNGDRYKRE